MAAITTYLDYNASAPLRPGVEQAVLRGLTTEGNPSSIHRAGRTAKRLLEDARDTLLSSFNRSDLRLVFTSGGTEANNLAIRGVSQVGIERVLIGATEHPSVWQAAEKSGLTVSEVSVDRSGRVELGHLQELLDGDESPALVCMMAANNETGVLHPLDDVSKICADSGALLHTDAVQCFGKANTSTAYRKADLISLSAHKIGGPLGVGALIFRSDLHIAPTIFGGGQEMGYRSGTENLSGVLGFSEAAKHAIEDTGFVERARNQRDLLEAGLKEISPATVIFGEKAERLPNTVCFGEPGIAAETAVMALDLAGIAVSAGSACSSGKVSKSQVISAMGWDDQTAGSSIRVSLGWFTEESDIERFLKSWADVRGRLLAKSQQHQSAEGILTGRPV